MLRLFRCLTADIRQDVKEQKKRQAMEELRARVLALLPESPVKIKTAGASSVVILERIREDMRQVEVRADDG